MPTSPIGAQVITTAAGHIAVSWRGSLPRAWRWRIWVGGQAILVAQSRPLRPEILLAAKLRGLSAVTRARAACSWLPRRSWGVPGLKRCL